MHNILKIFENWTNNLDPRRAHGCLWPIGRISAFDESEKQQPTQYEVNTIQRLFKIPAIRLAPIEAKENVHHYDVSEEDEEDAMFITQ